MTRIQKSIQLSRSVQAVFDFVTTPGNWPQWHPSSRGVSGATAHSLHVGDQVSEGFKVGWHQGRVVWTCRERTAPHHWVIEGQVEKGGGGTITYALTPHGDGTRFERTFVYEMPNRLLGLLDALFIRRLMAKASERALQQLKRVLEGDVAR